MKDPLKFMRTERERKMERECKRDGEKRYIEMKERKERER